ncbi:MAG: hypothetical protein P9L97_06195 [Candidatus Tenebribacter davisii]|nr:hypothetical protein [Candidatus Tenebribacter davisii]
MSEELIKIFVWSDNTWMYEDDIEDGDLDWFCMETGKSDDFAEYQVSLDLEADDIQMLIDLNSLPGMLPDPVASEVKPIEEMGKISIPVGAIVIVSHSKDIDYSAVTMLEDRLIVNAPDLFIEVIMPKEE